MPTMIQKHECTVDGERHYSRYSAEECLLGHGYNEGDFASMITELDLWECDGNDCQQQFEDQFEAQACETSHETGAEDGRQRPDPRRMDGNTAMRWISDALGVKS